MKTSKETDKGKKRKRGKSSAIEGTGGFLQFCIRLDDGDIVPEERPQWFPFEEVSKFESFIGFREHLVRTTSCRGHLRPLDFDFRLADMDILTFEDFKRCLSEATFTDPIQVIVSEKQAKDTKRLSGRDTLIARYKQHAPSSMDQHTVKHIQCPSNGDGPVYRCDRPPFDTLPGPLLHPVFGEFEDNLQNSRLQTWEDHAFVRDFCDTSVEFFKRESDRQGEVSKLLGQYLRRKIITDSSIEFCNGWPVMVEALSDTSCDGCIRGNSQFPIYAILAVENELGSTSTLKDCQGVAYYSRFCIEGMEKRAFLFSTCPAFLIEIRGPHIRVSAMTYQDRVTSTFLTDLVNIVHSNSMKLASVFKALKLGLDSLETFYGSIQGKAEVSKRLPFLDEVVPYSLWLKPNYNFKRSIGNKQLVFLAEDANKREVVIKFCRRYGDQVHRAWYDMGFAPELLEVQRLAGGFYLVAMEFLGHPWKTFLLLDDLEKTECRSVVLEALKKVHGLSVFGPTNAGSVHGDAREGNIMVRRRNGVFEVKFIDFDWAGQDSVSTYPFKMNHAQIAWPDGVSDGMPMQQSHDVHIVSNPPGASLYSWRRHV